MKPLSLNPLYLIEYQIDMKVLPTIFVYYTTIPILSVNIPNMGLCIPILVTQ